MKRIYLDYAATTPVDKVVLKAMLPYFSEKYGNASSLHYWGQEAIGAVDKARQTIADFFECDWQEIIFTGSATEANNLAIGGLVNNFQFSNPHIISTNIEHESIREPLRELQKIGHEITYVKCDKNGFINVLDIARAVRPSTALVSVIYANNEIGTIQPIKEIGRRLEKINTQRKTKGLGRIYFHTDAVQAVQYLESRPNWLKIDLITFSGHKIYGPKGIGGLFVRKHTPLESMIRGGGQEFGLRSGTENTALIVGLAKAFEILKKTKAKEFERVSVLRDKLHDFIVKSLPKVKLNGSKLNRLPNNLNFLFEGIEAQILLPALDQAGLAVSAGSACQARSLESSPVLRAIGLTEKQAKSSLRFSLGRQTTLNDIKRASAIIMITVKSLKS